MSARYGSLGVAIELSAHCYAAGCGTNYLDTPLSNASWFVDALTLLNAPAAGYLAIDYRMEGTWESVANGPGWTDQAMWLNLNLNGQNYSLGTHSALANSFGQPDTSGTFFNENTLWVPYSSTSIGITMRMDAWARCETGPNGDCKARMMFGNTGSVGGFRVLDAAGNPVTGATVTSQSGHDYMAPLDSASVPEPGGLAPLAIGLTLAVTAQRRRRR
ncbi:MAG: PEP-CTERM sorting domain-containing protein [Bryobacterales bacterium]|nr:PEP-CTERM sorting domain-containing protein [Bryobacterales bacterium]